jgi:dTDP-4-amino-4,6-dideoxygalactose transaminase
MQMPRSPVLGWASFAGPFGARYESVDGLLIRAFTASGRAAIYQALLQLRLREGSEVLVPTYHCPTMIAPVVKAGLRPRFYGIEASGLPNLPDDAQGARAAIAAHYFGLPRSFLALRNWCDERDVALIEDCAHSFFGQAGERPVGRWGDFATASISKFFPVPEAGLLASAHRPLGRLELATPGWRSQIKGAVDVIELGARYRGFDGLNNLLDIAFRLKNGGRVRTTPGGTVDLPPDENAMMRGCDMDRIQQAPLSVSRWIAQGLPRTRMVRRRRAHYRRFLDAFAHVQDARPLRPELPDDAVPYVFPLWVDDADPIYHALRRLSAPVFRWDHVWPRTPELAGDCGPSWSRHVLQLLCHQDLTDDDIDQVAATILRLLNAL